MSNSVSAFTTIEVSELAHVSGGSDPATKAGTKAAVKVGGKLAAKAIPIAGQIYTAVDAGVEAYGDYNKARQRGAGVMEATGQGALGALNSLTFGASNWLLGRN